jgi:F-type H+-transporting ATPase subunit b
MDASFFAFVGLIIFLGVVVYFKVPGMITGALDNKADAIRKELDEARRLREEAQSVLSDYQRKAREAEKEAGAIIAEAKAQAERLTEATNKALAEMIARRTKAAETKIAQAETQAIAEVRGVAVDVAIAAAEKVLATRATGSLADDLVKTGIAQVRSTLN